MGSLMGVFEWLDLRWLDPCFYKTQLQNVFYHQEEDFSRGIYVANKNNWLYMKVNARKFLSHTFYAGSFKVFAFHHMKCSR